MRANQGESRENDKSKLFYYNRGFTSADHYRVLEDNKLLNSTIVKKNTKMLSKKHIIFHYGRYIKS